MTHLLQNLPQISSRKIINSGKISHLKMNFRCLASGSMIVFGLRIAAEYHNHYLKKLQHNIQVTLIETYHMPHKKKERKNLFTFIGVMTLWASQI